MLKSFLREIMGSVPDSASCAKTLLAFRGECRVLVLFEGAADERPEVQEDYIANQQDVLSRHDIVLLRVVGGGVFSSLDNPVDIDVDDLRSDLNGPSPEEFEAVLVDRDGAVIFRSPLPVPVSAILSAIEIIPGQRS